MKIFQQCKLTTLFLAAITLNYHSAIAAESSLNQDDSSDTAADSQDIVATEASNSNDDQTESSDLKVYEFRTYTHLINAFENLSEGVDIYDPENWQELELDRHQLEMLIFQVAPILGGCECKIVLNSYEVDTPHARSIEQVISGEELSHPIAVFGGDSRVQSDLYLSDPVLAAEDFFVGLYTHEDRQEVLSITDEDQVRDLRFVAGQDWEIDNKIIDDYGLPHILADNWKSVTYMLRDGRADVLMQPFFPTSDLSFMDDDMKFIPIPNMRMRFPQSRVYFVSKVHPDGREFSEYLNKGIRILSEGDFLKRAHEWAGVINPATEEFEIIFED